VKSLNPINRRKTRLKQKGMQNVVNGANRTFGFPILLRGIWTRHAECNTMREEERAGLRVVEFSAVITLDTLDGDAKLRANISEKI